jgi:RsiW-degrading membrane proteinase PrsW (M82 family)
MVEAITAIVFLTLFAIWRTENWFNLLIKVVMLGSAVALGFEALSELGYIISV